MRDRSMKKEQTQKSQKVIVFPAGIEPATLRVWGARDNHYTTETEMKEVGN